MKAPWTRLRDRGVLGINERNIRFTLGENPRRLYPLVDNKLKTKETLMKTWLKYGRIFLEKMTSSST